MDSVGVILGVLAMFVALAGVFFSSTALKKVDEANATFIKSHLDPLTAEVVEIKSTLNKTRKLAEGHQSEFAAIKDARKEIATALRDIEVRLESLKSDSPAVRHSARSSWE